MATPPGATDFHTHVFESRFPMIPNRGYTLPDSNLADKLAMHHQIGIERVVLTQPSIYGIAASVGAPGALIEVVRTALAEGEASGLGDLNDSAIAEVIRRRAGIGRGKKA